jgi:predicted nucleotidyltransferase
LSALDPGTILRHLVDADVRFVLIGGMAGIFLGSTTVTQDLDICYAREKDNPAKLAAVLKALSARPRGLDRTLPAVVDARTLRNGSNFTFETSAGPLDCLAEASGGFNYTNLAPNATTEAFEGMDIPVVSLDDLVRMKRAAGRPKDLIEVENLSALREVRDRRRRT